MSGDVTRADWLAGIRGGRTDWTGLAERRRLQLAAPNLLAALRLAEGLIESGIEAIWGDDEPDPECRHIAGLTVIRAAIASATGDA